MTGQRLTFLTVSHILMILFVIFAMASIIQAGASAPPAVLRQQDAGAVSSCPALDAAAKSFAEGRLDAAVQEFETLSQDASIPSFARGLALFGLAEIALARQDFDAAIAAWKRLSADSMLLWFHRDSALRRIAEAERLQKGLPARDPASSRVKLPVSPTAGKAFYVSPTGSDIADGSQRTPFRTLERARDAIRSLKRSDSGKLPKGGVRIMIGGGEYLWEQTLKLTSEDSGTAAAPIVYQAEPGQTAVFRAGARIIAWKPISNAKLREKLDVRIRDRVLEADLKALGIKDLGDATALRHCPELFVDGKPQTLTPGRHFVENCRIFDISRLKRTYTPAVHLDGCGNRIVHNLFENIPSSALRIEGNDHLIELNVVRNVVRESDDQGGLDMFGNPLYRGVVIRWNHWSDIGGGTEHGAAGVRLDDMISGVAVYGNVFERCGAVHFGGVQIHGDKENLVEGNLFIDCLAGISFSRWGRKRWLESIERFLPQAAGPAYLSRYPELANLKANADVNFICRNIFVRCGSVFLRDGQVQKTALNVTSTEPLETQVMPGRQFPGDLASLKSLLFESIPFDEIGPYESN